MDPPAGDFIGIVAKADGDIRMRLGESINWRTVKKNDLIYSKTYLYTGENSSAIYGFTDETSITIGSNSMIFMDSVTSSQNKKTFALELFEGEMQVQVKEKNALKTIKFQDSTINVDPNKKVIATLVYDDTLDETEFSVFEGEINIQKNNESIELKSGEQASLKKEGAPPEVRKIDQALIDKIKKQEQIEQEQIIKDLRQRREFSYVLQIFRDFLRGDF